MENNMEIDQKFKNRTIMSSSNPTAGHIAKGNKISISKIYLHSYVHSNIIHSSQDMEAT